MAWDNPRFAREAARQLPVPHLFCQDLPKMKLVPLGENVVIKRLDAEETTSGGIVLPDSAQKKPQQGRVLSVGDGRLLPCGTRASHQVTEGDRVLFPQYSGTEVEIDGEELLIMTESEILAVVT
jgi:chaperonin GroES